MAKDPVCGMMVKEASALRAERDGHTFYFCGERCRQKFLSTPVTAKHEKKPQGKAIYTCPMHPQIVRDEPGNCPICGRSLEPREVASEEEVNPEVIDMTRRLWVATLHGSVLWADTRKIDKHGEDMPEIRSWKWELPHE